MYIYIYIMNRVRKVNNKYQVLITPHHRFHSGFELMLGLWTDTNLSGFKVDTFDSWEEAMERSYQMPDINWDQLVLFHKDIFAKLFQIIKYEIRVNNIDVKVEPKLLNPYQLKDVMFSRVLVFGERFRLGYHMNDIFSFHITSVYSSNLIDLSEILSINQELRINNKTNNDGIIRLIGTTDIGTSYEIVLWPMMIADWGAWANKNLSISSEIKLKKLKDARDKQQIIDSKNGIE
jgi:hypothetical protein